VLKRLLIFTFVLCGFYSLQITSLFAHEIKTIHITSTQWKGYTNENGTGVYWEVIKAVFETIGIKVNTKLFPWKRAERTVLIKKSDALLGAYYHKDKELLYPKWHISVEDPIVVIFKKTAISDWKNKGIKSLSGKKVGWIRGYGFEKTLFENTDVKHKELSKISSGLLMLNAGRIDALIDYESEIRPWSNKNNIDLEKDYYMKVAKLGNKLFLAFSNTQRSKKLITIFDDRMDKLVKSGEIENIYLKWGHSKKKFSKDRYTKD